MQPCRCGLCGLPGTFPGTASLDEKGRCSFCRGASPAPPRPRGIEKFLRIIRETMPADSDYDCAVALSGGRDSTYVLYYLVRILGLRPLAYTFQHGMLPEHTLRNIRTAVDALGVHHVMIPGDVLGSWVRSMLDAWVHRPSARTATLLCLGCRQEMLSSFIEVAARYKTPIVVNGAGEDGMSDYFAAALFTKRRSGWRRHFDIALGFGSEFLRNPRFLRHPSALRHMFREYAAVAFGLRRRRLPVNVKAISLFEFIPWDEGAILGAIQGELGWRGSPDASATWRSDCNLAILKYQFYAMTLGFTPHDAMVAESVRKGALTREQGLARLSEDNAICEGFLKAMLEKTGVTAPRHFWDLVAEAKRGALRPPF